MLFRLGNVFCLHYDNEPDADDDDDADQGDGQNQDKGKEGAGKTKAGRYMTQDEIDQIVEKRTSKARAANKRTLEQLEGLQATVKMSDEQKEQLEGQIDELRKKTFTAEEIAKREKQLAEKAYSGKLSEAEKRATLWQDRYKSTRIQTAISEAAREHGVTTQSVPFLEAFLKNTTQLIEKKDETGQVIDFDIQVNFNDVGADGKTLPVQLPVGDTVKRMKELPDLFGHLFPAPAGGVGGNSGRNQNPAAKGFAPGMSMDEYMRRRKEDPTSVLGG